MENCELCNMLVDGGWDVSSEGEAHLTCVLSRAKSVCSKCEAYYWLSTVEVLAKDGLVCPECGGEPRKFSRKEIPKHIEEAKKEHERR